VRGGTKTEMANNTDRGRMQRRVVGGSWEGEMDWESLWSRKKARKTLRSPRAYRGTRKNKHGGSKSLTLWDSPTAFKREKKAVCEETGGESLENYQFLSRAITVAPDLPKTHLLQMVTLS